MNLVKTTFEKAPCQCFGELDPYTCVVVIPWQLDHFGRSSSIPIVKSKTGVPLLSAKLLDDHFFSSVLGSAAVITFGYFGWLALFSFSVDGWKVAQPNSIY